MLTFPYPEIASGRNGLDVGKVAAHAPKKQPRMADRRLSFSWTFRQEANNSTP